MLVHLQLPIRPRLIQEHIIRRLERAIGAGEDIKSNAENIAAIYGVWIGILHAESCYAGTGTVEIRDGGVFVLGDEVFCCIEGRACYFRSRCCLRKLRFEFT